MAERNPVAELMADLTRAQNEKHATAQELKAKRKEEERIHNLLAMETAKAFALVVCDNEHTIIGVSETFPSTAFGLTLRRSIDGKIMATLQLDTCTMTFSVIVGSQSNMSLIDHLKPDGNKQTYSVHAFPTLEAAEEGAHNFRH